MTGGTEQDPQDARPGRTGRDSDDRAAPRAYALIGIGFEFLAAICLCGAVGWWLDRRTNTFPWLTLAGAAVGFAAGLMLLIRAARDAFKD